MANNKQCPICKSKETHKYGTIKTSREPRKQRYHCRICGSTFY